MAAEEVGAPGCGGRQQEAAGVVGDERPRQQGERREEEREPWYRGRPEEVDSARGPDGVADERVLAVKDRGRPPAEAPDERLRVAAVAEVVVARLDQQP